jgi:modulator of FtsH protease
LKTPKGTWSRFFPPADHHSQLGADSDTLPQKLSAYDPGAWHDFFVTGGTAAAALTGLLFVALSIQMDRILGNPEHRFRARGNFFGLTVVMVMALVVLIPTLSGRWLGVGIIVPNVAAAAVNAWHIRRVLPTFLGGSIIFPLRVAFSYVLIAMGIVGGVSVVLGAGGGLVWPAIESIGMLLIALLGAWSLLVGVAQRSGTAVRDQGPGGR